MYIRSLAKQFQTKPKHIRHIKRIKIMVLVNRIKTKKMQKKNQ